MRGSGPPPCNPARILACMRPWPWWAGRPLAKPPPSPAPPDPHQPARPPARPPAGGPRARRLRVSGLRLLLEAVRALHWRGAPATQTMLPDWALPAPVAPLAAGHRGRATHPTPSLPPRPLTPLPSPPPPPPPPPSPPGRRRRRTCCAPTPPPSAAACSTASRRRASSPQSTSGVGCCGRRRLDLGLLGLNLGPLGLNLGPLGLALQGPAGAG
jgi:hypothetical protein